MSLQAVQPMGEIMHSYKAIKQFLFAALVSLAPLAGAHADDWPTFGKTAQRQGYNGQETVLTAKTAPGLHLLWQVPMNGPILTQPLVASAIPLDDGTRTGRTTPVNLAFVADMTGLVAAFDVRNGRRVWGSQLPALPTSCADFPDGKVGVIGTPTIDKANNRMWVVAADGTLWALALDTGGVLPGYPLQILDPGDSNGASLNYGGLTYDNNGSLYVTTAGQCDVPPYFGQIIKLSVGVTAGVVPGFAASWFPTLAYGVFGGGIWGFGGVSLEPDNTSVYTAIGNAFAVPENTGFANHVVKLTSNLQTSAANAPYLVGEDVDFGATPMLYQAPNCPPQMAVMNKTGDLFVYPRTVAGITAGPTQRVAVTQAADTGGFIGLPAYDPVSNRLFLGNPKDNVAGGYLHGLLAFQVLPNCTLSLAWQQTVGFEITKVPDNPSIPPTVANGVVYYSTGSASSIFAFGADGTYLWNSGKQILGGIFAPPTVVNGVLLAVDYGGSLTAFGP